VQVLPSNAAGRDVWDLWLWLWLPFLLIPGLRIPWLRPRVRIRRLRYLRVSKLRSKPSERPCSTHACQLCGRWSTDMSWVATLRALPRLACCMQEALSATCSIFARPSRPALQIRSDCAKPAAFIQPAASAIPQHVSVLTVSHSLNGHLACRDGQPTMLVGLGSEPNRTGSSSASVAQGTSPCNSVSDQCPWPCGPGNLDPSEVGHRVHGCRPLASAGCSTALHYIYALLPSTVIVFWNIWGGTEELHNQHYLP